MDYLHYLRSRLSDSRQQAIFKFHAGVVTKKERNREDLAEQISFQTHSQSSPTWLNKVFKHFQLFANINLKKICCRHICYGICGILVNFLFVLLLALCT